MNNKKFSFLVDTIKQTLAKLEEYWPKIYEYSAVCMILDPRFKAKQFKKGDKAESIKAFQSLFDSYQAEAEVELTKVIP